MKINRRMISIALLGWVLTLAGGPALAQSSENYAVKPSVISGGGHKTASLNYTLLSTIGQSSAIGISSSDSYLHYAGFWHTLRLNRMFFLPLIIREE